MDLSCIIEEGLLDALQPKAPKDINNLYSTGVSKFQTEYLDTLNGLGNEATQQNLNKAN